MNHRVLLPLVAVLKGLNASPHVSIHTPKNDSRAPQRTCVTGNASAPGGKIALVVHPLRADDYWVQITSVRTDGTFKILAHLGDQQMHHNERFEMRAVLNPASPLRQGHVLTEWPDGEAASGVVEVTRVDGQPDGCGSATPLLTDASLPPKPTIRPEITPAIPHAPASVPNPPLTNTDDPGRPIRETPHSQLERLFVPTMTLSGILLLVLFWALAELPHRAAAAEAVFATSLRHLWEWVSRYESTRATQFASYGNGVCEYATRAGNLTWKNRGFHGTSVDFATSILLALLLCPLALIASFVDAKALLPAMVLVFGSHDEVATMQTSLDVAAVTSIRHFATTLLRDVIMLWQERHGPIAIGLACVQGAFGLALFDGDRQEDVKKAKWLGLLGERPVLAPLFVLLTIALAGLAAYRAYELAPGDWLAPAFLSAATAFIMPWVMAISLHIGLLYLNRCLGMTLTLAVILAVVGIAAAAALGLLIVFLALAAPPAILLIAHVVVRLIAGLYIWMAQVIGDLIRQLRSRARDPRSPVGGSR